MPLAGRAYLALAAIVLTAMATRVGWINWHLILVMTAIMTVGLLVFLLLAAVLVGLPTFALLTCADWLFGPAPAHPTEGGHDGIQ